MKVRICAIFLLLIGILTLVGSPAYAVPTPDRSLGISPLRTELTIVPGTSFDGKLTLINSGHYSLSITMSAEVFGVTDQAYDYSFDPTGTGVDWVTFGISSLSIEPGKSASVSYKVAVPLSAEPGGRYISLFASSSPIASTTAVTSINRIASLLYITVDGSVSRTGTLLAFSSPFLTFGNPAWSAVVHNSGSTHFHSPYSVTVTSLLGGSVLKTAHGDSLILPSSVRAITQPIPNPDWLGIYRLNYTVGLGDVPAHQETRWIVYLPPLQTIIAAAIVTGILLLWLMPKRKKKAFSKQEG